MSDEEQTPENSQTGVGVTARISGWLADQLEAEIQKRPRGKRPTRGELLEQAWKKATPPITSANHHSDSTEESKNLLETQALHIDNQKIPDRDTQWIKKLTYILLYGDIETKDAITRNLERFELLARILRRDLDLGTGANVPNPPPVDPRKGLGRIRELTERHPGVRKRLERNARRTKTDGAEDDKMPRRKA